MKIDLLHHKHYMPCIYGFDNIFYQRAIAIYYEEKNNEKR